MSAPLVLLTGATGHVGFAVLLEALDKGYRIRAAVRNQAAVDRLKSQSYLQSHLENIEFILVPDITLPGAYDEAVKGVTFILHIASPLPRPTDDVERDIIQPAIDATTGMLNSALTSSTLQRLVITASIASVGGLSGGDPDRIIDPNSSTPDPPTPQGNPMRAYGVSKTRAHNVTRAFVEKNKPKFSIVNIMPGLIIGPNRLATTTAAIDSGSNPTVLGILLGRQLPPITDQFAHIDDVAHLHVAALSHPELKGVSNFAVATNGLEGGIDIDSANGIAREKLVEEVKEGIFPLGGHQDFVKVKYDTSNTEKVFGYTFKTFEDMVVDLGKWYAQAWRKEHA